MRHLKIVRKTNLSPSSWALCNKKDERADKTTASVLQRSPTISSSLKKRRTIISTRKEMLDLVWKKFWLKEIHNHRPLYFWMRNTFLSSMISKVSSFRRLTGSKMSFYLLFAFFLEFAILRQHGPDEKNFTVNGTVDKKNNVIQATQHCIFMVRIQTWPTRLLW